MQIINFISGPGAGKSSFACGLFSRLKFRGINCEYISEYAKDLTYENRHVALGNQLHVSSTQQYRIHRLKDQVDFAITDSPIILGVAYYNGDNPHFNATLLHEFNRYNNINYFIKRVKKYSQHGRFHTEEEAKKIDVFIQEFLNNNNIAYTTIPGIESSLDKIVNKILNTQ